MRVHWKKVACYVGCTFGLSWTLAGVYYALGGRLSSASGLAMVILYMFTPLAGAWLTQKVVYREPAMRALGIHFRLNWWWLLASLVPLAMAFAALGVGLLLPGTYFDPSMSGFLGRFAPMLAPEELRKLSEQMTAVPPWQVLLFATLTALAAAYTVNGLAGFGEEAGWRGLLLRELAPLGFWRATALIGMIWGV